MMILKETIHVYGLNCVLIACFKPEFKAQIIEMVVMVIESMVGDGVNSSRALSLVQRFFYFQTTET